MAKSNDKWKSWTVRLDQDGKKEYRAFHKALVDFDKKTKERKCPHCKKPFNWDILFTWGAWIREDKIYRVTHTCGATLVSIAKGSLVPK